jgi:ABC-2 type transport system permease protein
VSLSRAGAFLLVTSAKNRVRVGISKLREPRYLVGAAALGLYLWSLFFRHALHEKADPDLVALQTVKGEMRIILTLGLTVLGAVTVWVSWTLGLDRLSFSFNEAEATWLLSGPVSRRGIVRYKVAVGLVRTLMSALLATLIFRRGVGSATVPLVLGTWLGFSLLWLHGAAASLTRTGWRQAGVSVSRRVVVGTALLLVFFLAGFLALRQAGPPPSLSGESFASVRTPLSAWLRALAESPALAWLCLPAQAFAGAVFARADAQALGPVLVLFLLDGALLAWVLLLDVPLEEAALASAERRSRLESRRRRRGLPLPRLTRAVRLAGTGRPEVALAWKNWLALRRVHGARLGLILGIFGLGFGSSAWGVFHKSRGGTDVRLLLAACAVGVAALTVLLGPLLFRTDLRADLRRLDVLRTLPLSGLQVVRGELLAPALLLGTTQVALLLLAFGLSVGAAPAGLSLAARLCWTLGALLLLPVATSAMLVVQNAAALVFPSLLVDDEESSPRGVEAAGTRLLNLGASLLLLLLGGLPGALLGLAVGVLGRLVGLGPFAYTLGCATMAAVLALEVSFALAWMGKGLERLDPSVA